MGNDILGYVGVFLSSFLFIPQIVHMIQYKSSESISYYFLIVSWFTYCTWITYGITEKSNPIILSSSIALFFTFCMFCIKNRYDNKPRPVEHNYVIEGVNENVNI
ncbi:MAG: hypothetical protein CL678_01880 [Bdellovibrionaceae bacterium]|nr:hypothetical protein [Pseudobdellovibrionaceae bacterium]|tara:strand:- start:64 stop:378 length:315 start_codon:yes stop_codon:yes gene_type:complete